MRFDVLRRVPRRLALRGFVLAALALAIVAVAALAAPPSAAPLSASAATPSAVSAHLGPKIPTSGAASFSWSPDGALLFVADGSGGRVFDRVGQQVATVPAAEGWLDATHLIGWDGVTSDARQSRAGTSPADVRVVASGHGAAAIVTGEATCASDPEVRWYRNGKLDASSERANPLGWSPDGMDVLVGHAACADESATPWQGDVQVVDFASGDVEGTLPGVTGVVAFGVEADSIAAQAGDSIEIVDEGAPQPVSLAGTQFLGWLDVETIFLERDGAILVADLDPPTVSDATPYERWQAAGPKGVNLAASLDGSAAALVGEDGSTLLDLSGDGLSTRAAAAGLRDQASAALEPGWWAPDGRTLALAAADGKSLTLISVESTNPS